MQSLRSLSSLHRRIRLVNLLEETPRILLHLAGDRAIICLTFCNTVVTGFSYPHCREPRQYLDDLIDIFRNEWLSILFKFVIFQTKPQLLYRGCSIDNGIFTHKHDPTKNEVSLASNMLCEW